MAGYIDVDKLIDKINSRIKNTLIRGWLASIINETIIEQSTAEVEEVKHGEWKPIVKQDNYLDPPHCEELECSECGTAVDVSFCNAKYCYECGAKMDGKKE